MNKGAEEKCMYSAHTMLKVLQCAHLWILHTLLIARFSDVAFVENCIYEFRLWFNRGPVKLDPISLHPTGGPCVGVVMCD